MPKRTAQAKWEGGLKGGSGVIQFGSGAFEGAYSAGSRFNNDKGTNPEELIAAAHAGCFSMALAAMLEQAGFHPTDIQTGAEVNIEKTGEGFGITDIVLSTVATVPDIDAEEFQKHAQTAKANCPVSRALAGTTIHLKAELKH
jgi:osmotically inducible protein OsmC